MTAKQEINNWKEEYCKLNTDAERAAFKEKIFTSLGNKNAEELANGLSALKEVVHEVRIEAEKKQKSASIEVFPASEKDKAMLEALLVRMGIPYRISA